LSSVYERVFIFIVVVGDTAGLGALNLLEGSKHNAELTIDILTESLSLPAGDCTLNKATMFQSFKLFDRGFGGFPCGGGEGFARCGSL
jgi:hypothetical protein